MTISLGPSASTGTLEANQVKVGGTLSVNGVDIDALIAQRIYTLFNVPSEIGLPSSTDYEVVRNSIGHYTVTFSDTVWNNSFSVADYSVCASQRGRSFGTISSPARTDLFVKNKTNQRFDFELVEREPGVDGTQDTARDAAVIDFCCQRGMVCFCQGSFRGGAIGSFGKYD